jgi:hypothetical protein
MADSFIDEQVTDEQVTDEQVTDEQVTDTQDNQNEVALDIDEGEEL